MSPSFLGRLEIEKVKLFVSSAVDWVIGVCFPFLVKFLVNEVFKAV